MLMVALVETKTGFCFFLRFSMLWKHSFYRKMNGISLWCWECQLTHCDSLGSPSAKFIEFSLSAKGPYPCACVVPLLPYILLMWTC